MKAASKQSGTISLPNSRAWETTQPLLNRKFSQHSQDSLPEDVIMDSPTQNNHIQIQEVVADSADLQGIYAKIFFINNRFPQTSSRNHDFKQKQLMKRVRQAANNRIKKFKQRLKKLNQNNIKAMSPIRQLKLLMFFEKNPKSRKLSKLGIEKGGYFMKLHQRRIVQLKTEGEIPKDSKLNGIGDLL